MSLCWWAQNEGEIGAGQNGMNPTSLTRIQFMILKEARDSKLTKECSGKGGAKKIYK